MNWEELALRGAIGATGMPSGVVDLYRQGRSMYDSGKKTVQNVYNNSPEVDFALRNLGLRGGDEEVDLPEVKTPTTVSPIPPGFAGAPGKAPMQYVGMGDGLPQDGVAMAMRQANAERHAAAMRMAEDKANFAAQGMTYFAPGLGYKGGKTPPGPASAFGQSYNATQGTYSSPVARGGEREAELNLDQDLRGMERDAQRAMMENRLAQASMSPAEVARLQALAKTQYRVDPVEQQAFGMGLKMANARRAALEKAWNDAGGDPEKFAKAKMRVDELYPLDAETLISNALGQRATQAGMLGFAGE